MTAFIYIYIYKIPYRVPVELGTRLHMYIIQLFDAYEKVTPRVWHSFYSNSRIFTRDTSIGCSNVTRIACVNGSKVKYNTPDKGILNHSKIYAKVRSRDAQLWKTGEMSIVSILAY